MDDKSIDDRLDELFDYIDSLLCDGDFDTVDNVLKYLVIPSVSVDMLIGYASITFAAKDKLKERKAFMERLREEITKREPDMVYALLQGLD